MSIIFLTTVKVISHVCIVYSYLWKSSEFSLKRFTYELSNLNYSNWLFFMGCLWVSFWKTSLRIVDENCCCIFIFRYKIKIQFLFTFRNRSSTIGVEIRKYFSFSYQRNERMKLSIEFLRGFANTYAYTCDLKKNIVFSNIYKSFIGELKWIYKTFSYFKTSPFSDLNVLFYN